MRIGCDYHLNQDIIYKCVFVSEQLAVLRVVTEGEHWGKEHCVYKSNWQGYNEYVEPRHEFFNAFQNDIGETTYGGPYRYRIEADRFNNARIRYGVLELIHHSDTKVESIFHLVGEK